MSGLLRKKIAGGYGEPSNLGNSLRPLYGAGLAEQGQGRKLLGGCPPWVRGQLHSPDLVFGVSIFFAAVLVFSLFWYSAAGNVVARGNEGRMALLALAAADELLATGGEPANWVELPLASVNSLGIADSYAVINSNKLGRLAQLNASGYEDVKQMLGAGAHELYISVAYQNGTRAGEFGKQADRSAAQVRASAVDRLSILNGSVVNVKVVVWK